MSPSEQDARIKIDDQLRAVGWDLNDKQQVRTEVPVALSSSVREPLPPYGNNPPARTTGYADYVLCDQDGQPLAVIEAKKEALHPYRAKQQALPYAKSIGAPFIFLTNGELIYFWDYTNDDARVVNSFYSPRDLERLLHLRDEQKPLATIPIPEYYLRQGEQREVRPYQKSAMQALDHAIELGKRRFLLELPTGTGKTDVVTLYLKRLFEAGKAERVLFLVDREQLAKQAIEAIQDLLPTYSSYWLKSGTERQEQQISVALLQTMTSKYLDFSSGYFDVVIADECHRSIYGSWQTALTHFDAVHIGLTATPSMYIERNTFEFYQCKEEQPDYSHDLIEAFKEGHLTPYKFAEGITLIMSEGADVEEEHYDPSEFERKWTNEKTNRLMMEEFDRLAWQNFKELAPGQNAGPGKAIVFAITKNHASRLTEYLNQLHPELKGQYAQVITSDVQGADDLIRKFKYDTYPMVAVSVGMLDTGFDCREVLHLVMCRRVRSPILYQQMRGRGTRTCPKIDKQKFVIYDFFGNHEYFNDTDTDIFAGGGSGHASATGRKVFKPKRDLVELGLEDEWLEAVQYVEVGPAGERVDKKEYVSRWERVIQDAAADDIILQKIRNHSTTIDEAERVKYALTPEEEQELSNRLNQPEMYFNEDNLRRAYRTPGGTLIDFIKYALGLAKQKTREQDILESFHAWLVTKNFNVEQAQYLSLLKNRGVLKGVLAIDDLFKPPLSILNAAGRGIELFGEIGLRNVVEEMNESVFGRKAS